MPALATLAVDVTIFVEPPSTATRAGKPLRTLRNLARRGRARKRLDGSRSLQLHLLDASVGGDESKTGTERPEEKERDYSEAEKAALSIAGDGTGHEGADSPDEEQNDQHVVTHVADATNLPTMNARVVVLSAQAAALRASASRLGPARRRSAASCPDWAVGRLARTGLVHRPTVARQGHVRTRLV